MVRHGDYVVDDAGRTLTVSGVDKCAQDVLETLTNEYDTLDPPWYQTGSEFHMINDPDYAYQSIEPNVMIKSMAQDAIDRLRSAQENDPYVDDEELIDHVVRMIVNQVGPLSYAFFAQIVTASEEQVKASFDLDYGSDLTDAVEMSGLNSPGEGTFL